jgi:hypothetical protein
MRKKTAYTSFVLALTCCSTAHAAKNVEVVRYPSLFMFGGIGQSVGVSYSYSQHATENSSTSGSSARESYNFGTVLAILDPHIVNMQVRGGLSYSQNFDEPTNTLLNGEYNIIASAFDMSYHPFTVGSSRSTAVISNGYTPSYSLTNSTHQISGALMNTTLPLQLYYVRSSSETSGLDNNTSGTSNALGFSLQHYLKQSDTRFSFDHGTSDSEGSHSSSYSVMLSNSLSLDQAERYRLSSSLSASETSAEGLPQRDVSLSESLSCKFGRAFSGGLSESFSYSSTTGFGGEERESRNNGISASLSHMLYQSLGTSVSGSYSTGSSFGGETKSYGGALRFSYRKVLPAQTLLTAGFDRSTNIQSQHLLDPHTDSRVIVRGVTADQVIPPPAVSGRITVVSVTSFQPLETSPDLPDPAFLVYSYSEKGHPGAITEDYEVDATGALRILPTGSIPDTTSNLIIIYSIETNPDIEMRIDSTALTSSLALFGGRYNLSGSYTTQSQDIISGAANRAGLVDSQSLSLSAAANYHPTMVGVDYSWQSSSQEEETRISGYASRSWRSRTGESISVNLRDTYSMTDTSGQGGTSASQNTLSASASYARRFFRWLSFNIGVGASDSRGNGRYSDYLSVRALTTGSYNQLQFSLTGQTVYRIAGGGTTRDSNISGSITRFF